MDKTPVVIVEKTIGNTVYIIENVISENARETVYEKVKKLILNDAERNQNMSQTA